MWKKITAIILCLLSIVSILPLAKAEAVSTTANTTEHVNYGAVIGNTARFGDYVPLPITDDPTNISNPWGTECEFLSEGEIDKSILLVITNYYLDAKNNLWYKVGAAPGYVLPQKLQDYPWMYQDNVSSPVGASLMVHDSGTSTVFDAAGNAITYLEIGVYDTVVLECKSSLIGNPEYQWQVFIDDQWIDIWGENSKSVSVDFALLVNAADENGDALLRCVSTSGSSEIISTPITVSIDGHNNEEASGFEVEEPGNIAGGESAGVCYVTIQYLFENGTQAANSYVAEVPLNVESTVVADFPYVMGYEPYYDDEQQNQLVITETFTENIVYTVVYKAVEVTYTVDVYFQNIENDDYSFYDSKTHAGYTGSKVPLNTEAFEGMHELLHDTPEIAADSSTQVEVYYDRIYYMTRVYLAGGHGIYSVYARYGANLTTHLSAPSRPGYTFIGWDEYTVDSDGDDVPDSGGDGIADTVYPTVPAKNLAYVALWTESPTAGVKVVFWEENPNQDPNDPNDDFFYIETEVRDIAPDTVLKYSMNSGYICGLDEHTHSNECTVKCGLGVHVHNERCYELNCDKEHTHNSDCYNKCDHVEHSLSCYTNQTLTLASNLTGNNKSAYDRLRTLVGNPVNGRVYRARRSSGSNTNYNFFYFNNTWYYLGTGNQYKGISCGTISAPSYNTATYGDAVCSHKHDDDCLGCGKAEHTHTDYTGSCYKLICTTQAHTHDGTCYTCVEHRHSQSECGYPVFDKFDEDWWYLSEDEELNKPVTVERDGTTVLNVYFERTEYTLTFKDGNSTVYTIKEEWGTDLTKHWPIKGTNGTTYDQGQRWKPNNNCATFSAVLVYIAVMPKENITFTRDDGTTQKIYTMHYMVEVLPGEQGDREYNEKTFKEISSVKAKYSYLTKAEDFMDLEGYVQYGTSPAFSNNQINLNNGGDVYLYYTRLESKVELYSGNDIVDTRAVAYEQSLSVFENYTPDLPDDAEEGSLEFVGWYLNPECTGKQVDLNTAKMPSTTLALYAKWIPKYHDVRIVLEKKDDGNYGPEDSVLESGGEKVETIRVLHGNIVFSGNESKVPPNPENGKYKFLGWFYMDDNIELMWDFENQPIVKDTVIYAKWSSEVLVTYTVYFKDTEGNEIAPPIVSSSLAGHSVTVEAKVGNELSPEYRNRYFPQTTSHSIQLDIESAETGVEYTFVYEKAEEKKYFVHYVDKESGEPLKDTGEYMSSYAIVTKTYEAIEIDGVRYVPDEYQKTLVLSADENENHIYFYYTKSEVDAVWHIGYYVENRVNEGEYDALPSKGAVDKIGTEISAEWPSDLSKDGYEFGYATITVGESTTTVYSLDAAKGVMSKDGIDINVYFNRIRYPYKVVYRNKDTGAEIHESQIFDGDMKQPYGKTVTVTEFPTIEGYVYASSSNCTIVKDEAEITKNIIYVYYTEQSLRIDFKVMGPEGCGAVTPETIHVKYESDKSATVTAVPAKNYHFVGWYYDEGCTNPIVTSDSLKPNGEMMILQKADGWEAATYYAKFEASVADFTIVRENGEANQIYIYEVRNNETGDVITVTVKGSGSVTIKDLVVGEYTVTQKNDWSWRYSDSAITVTHDIVNKVPVTFNGGYAAGKDKWLNGNSNIWKNIFGGGA